MNNPYLSVDELSIVDELFTVDELSEKLKVPKSWVYSRTRETGPGTIPKIKAGKYIRFNLRAVLGWLKDQQEED